MKLSLNYKKILYVIFCSTFFYSVIFKEIEIIGYCYYYIMPLIFLVINYKFVIKIIKKIYTTSLKYYMGAIILIVIFSLLIPIIYKTFDFSYFSIRALQIVKESIKISFLLVYFIKYISPEYDYKLFIKYFILSTSIYVGFTCLTFLFPFLRELIIKSLTLSQNDVRLLNQENYFTRFGWCGFSGFTFTLKATLSVIFSLYIISIEKQKNFLANSLCLLLCFLGNLFYGRIGLVCSSICFFIFFIYLFQIDKLLFKKVLVLIIYSMLILCLIVVYSERFQMWFMWAFQSVINFFNSGTFSTTSTDVLENMYILPSIKSFFIGDGYYTTANGYYMNSDVGVLRTIFFGGIFLQILRYSTVFINLKNYIKNKIENYQLFMIFLIIMFVLFEIKGEIVFPIISILFAISCLIEMNNKDGGMYD